VQADDTDGAAPVEVLERDGAPGLSARSRRVLILLGAALCVLGVVAWRVDARARDRDERAVAACHDTALAADVRASSTVAYMVYEVEPALYKVSEVRRDGLVVLVAQAADRALPGVQRALSVCRGTNVAWWHRELNGQRTAYVDYLQARVTRLKDIASDGSHYYQDQPRLAALRDRAFGA
jgi:hypothetical protein